MKTSKLKSILIIELILIVVFAFTWVQSPAVDAATAKVTSVKNSSSGVLVRWNRDKDVKGYYVYRKDVGGRWLKVGKVEGSKKTKYTDKTAENGSTYQYRVAGFKGGKIKKNSTKASIIRVSRPKIKSLKTVQAGALKLSTGKNSKVIGYQIKYSKKKNFKNAKTVKIEGTKVDNYKKTGLSWGKKYYVKVRSYLVSGDKKYYSAWSKVKTKSAGAYINGYTAAAFTNAKVSTSGSTKVKIPYKSSVRVYEKIKKISKSHYVKIKYNGKTYYVWAEKGTTPFTTEPVKFSDYEYPNLGKLQQQLVYDALDIYRNHPTNYSHNTPGTIINGKMQFDCSGFVSYVVNGVMRPYIPSYKLSWNITTLYETEEIYTDSKGVFSQTTVCTGAPDLKKMKPGDVVYFRITGGDDVDHCGLYIGNGEFIHCTSSVGHVCIMPLTGNYQTRFVAAKRIVPTKEPAALNKTMTYRGGSVYNDPSLHEKIDSLSSGTKVQVLYYTLLTYTDDYQAAYIKYNGDQYGIVKSTRLY